MIKFAVTFFETCICKKKTSNKNKEKIRRGVNMLYHASGEIVIYPEIRISKYPKDFSWGFYCTNNYKQAERWARRNRGTPTINSYAYVENSDLKILRFNEMNDEWLNFIARCRSKKTHDYDIVEGPMANDTVWNYVNDFLDGSIPRNVFWELAKFRHPTHQMSFHTLRALECLTFEGSELANE